MQPPLEMGLALPGPFGNLSNHSDHLQMLARVYRVHRRGIKTHKPLGPYTVLLGGTADVKEDPHMDRLDSADEQRKSSKCQSVCSPWEGGEVKKPCKEALSQKSI